MKIQYKLLIAFLVILLMILPAVVIISVNNEQTNAAITKQFDIDQQSKAYQTGARDLQVGMYMYLQGNREIGRQMIDEGTTLMKTSREQLKIDLAGTPAYTELSEIEVIEGKVLEVSNDAVAIADGSAQNRDALLQQRFATLGARIEALNMRLSNFAEHSNKDLELTIEHSRQTTQQTLVGAFVIVFLISIGLAVFMANMLTKPINKLTEIANKVSMGNLDEEIDIQTNDEINDLADSFRRMINAFKMMVAMQENEEAKK
jgi:HAMP domain-containing protein